MLVHGEFERNDMVEYFGEQLDGFAFTSTAGCSRYGSRCVRPPIIFGDVSRPEPMTVRWSPYAQSLTERPMKGMLTGPVTILQWSFVRDDQPRAETCRQIALALRDEVTDLEAAGIARDPDRRAGLPRRSAAAPRRLAAYLDWAVARLPARRQRRARRDRRSTPTCATPSSTTSSSRSRPWTPTSSRSRPRARGMELLDAFRDFDYADGIGPGVYDIHSPRVPRWTRCGAAAAVGRGARPGAALGQPRLRPEDPRLTARSSRRCATWWRPPARCAPSWSRPAERGDCPVRRPSAHL